MARLASPSAMLVVSWARVRASEWGKERNCENLRETTWRGEDGEGRGHWQWLFARRGCGVHLFLAAIVTSGEREEEGEVVGVKAISLIFSFRASRPEICDAVRGERWCEAHAHLYRQAVRGVWWRTPVTSAGHVVRRYVTCSRQGCQGARWRQ